ncbi:unnamed protein product, partial [Rotaria sp. Silwood2]
MATTTSTSLKENHPSIPILLFIQSQKRKSLLVSNEYIFKLNKVTTTTTYWIWTDIESS